jgi:catechol 2,3-dioxygenase-like lactoylglutathione lyase family enzyme
MRHATGLILELFAYTANATTASVELGVGNDLTAVGLKHIAVQVEDLEVARAVLATNGYTSTTDNQRGRTQIDFFFVQDPDGLWVEVVRDVRSLDENNPVTLRQE